MHERRAHPRHSVELPLVQLLDDGPVEGFASDLSLTGLHVCRLVGPFARSSRRMGLRLNLPGQEEPLEVEAEVVYDAIDPFLHEMGLRFVDLSQEDHERLEEWLARRPSERAAPTARPL